MGKICIAVLVACLALLGTVSSVEDTDNYFNIPAHLRCDSCMAVTYHLYHGLQKMTTKSEEKKPSKTEIWKTLENACDAKNFHSYAAVEVKHRERLIGPGVDVGVISKATAEDSQQWVRKLANVCVDFAEKYGEDGTMYKIFKKNNKKRADFQNKICARMAKFCRVGHDEL